MRFEHFFLLTIVFIIGIAIWWWVQDYRLSLRIKRNTLLINKQLVKHTQVLLKEKKCE